MIIVIVHVEILEVNVYLRFVFKIFAEAESFVGPRGKIDNSRFFSLFYFGPQEVSQIKVTQMVDSYSHLKPIFCFLPLRWRKDSSVVYENINLLADPVDILAELFDRFFI